MNRRTALLAASGYLLAARVALADPADQQLRLTTFGHSSTLDPYRTSIPNVSDMAWLFADGLIGTNGKGPFPILATHIPSFSAGSITNGGRTVYYALKRNVVWHDGAPFGASDVAAAFRRVQASPWHSNRPFGLVKSLHIESSSIVRIDLSEPDPRFPISFFSAFGDPNLPLIRPGRFPIGTGPFSVSRFSERTGAYMLRKWKDAPRGLAHVQEIEYTFIPDQNTEAMGFVAGESDVALYLPSPFIEARRLRFATYTGGLVVLFANVTGTLSDARLRRLVWSAIDRKAIRDKVFGRWGLDADTIVPPELSGAYRFPSDHQDLAKVRNAIAALAHNGVRITYAGVPGLAEKIGVLLQAQLAAVGIDLDIKLFSPQEYFALGGPLHSGHFDLALDFAPYTQDPDLSDKFSCAATRPPGANYSRYCDPAVDRAIAEGGFSRAERILWEGSIVMPLAQIVHGIGIGPRVQKFRVQNYVPITYFCNEWSLK